MATDYWIYSQILNIHVYIATYILVGHVVSHLYGVATSQGSLLCMYWLMAFATVTVEEGESLVCSAIFFGIKCVERHAVSMGISTNS